MPFSFFQVKEVTPRLTFLMEDILVKKTYEVYERKATQTFKKEDLIFAKICNIKGIYILYGVGSTHIPLPFIKEIIDLRKEFLQELDKDPSKGQSLNEVDLNEFALSALAFGFFPSRPWKMNFKVYLFFTVTSFKTFQEIIPGIFVTEIFKAIKSAKHVLNIEFHFVKNQPVSLGILQSGSRFFNNFLSEI